MPEPAMRGNLDRFWLECLAARPELDAVFARDVQPEMLAAVEQTGRLAWSPLERFEGLRRPMFDHLGATAYMELARGLTVEALEHPIFKATGEVLLRLYARHPRALLHAFSRVWRITFRGLGNYTLSEAEDDHAQVRLVGAPGVAHRSDIFKLNTLAMLLGVVDIAGANDGRGEVTSDGVDLVFDFRWGTPQPG